MVERGSINPGASERHAKVVTTLEGLDPAVVLYLQLITDKGYGVIKDSRYFNLIQMKHSKNENCSILFFDGVPENARREFKKNYDKATRMSIGERMCVSGLCLGLVDRVLNVTHYRRPECVALRLGEQVKLRGPQDAIDRELQELEMAIVEGECSTDCLVCGTGSKGTRVTELEEEIRRLRLEAQGQRSAKKQTHSHVGRYNIDPTKPGYLLLIANSNFDSGQTRNGTERDIESLLNLFKGFGYHSTVCENATAGMIKEFVKLIATADDIRRYSCIVVALMSHGGTAGVLGIDGDIVSEEFVLKTLGESRILAAKPKLVLMQACRGGDKTPAVECMSSFGGGSVEADNSSIPAAADMIIAHATIAGQVALRHPKEGSFFIQSFCRIAERRGRDLPVDDILKVVRDDVVRQRAGEQYVVIPSASHNTLRRHFYLAA